MTIPAIILGIIISTGLGSLFHLWRGGGAPKFLLYLVLSWIGFWGGHFVGNLINIDVGKIGPLHVLFACLGSLILLAFGYWLSLVEIERL